MAATDNPLRHHQGREQAMRSIPRDDSGDAGAAEADFQFVRFKFLLSKEVGRKAMTPLEAFGLFDFDFSGTIDGDKFHAGLSRLGVEVDRSKSDVIMRRHFDTANSRSVIR
jgi:hypothetical protein